MSSETGDTDTANMAPVDSDVIDRSVEMLRDELAGSLDAFEVASGFQVCFRPLSDRWDDPKGRSISVERYVEHRSAFCLDWKERALPACTRCDNNELLPACAPAGQPRFDGFVRTCHAGADEVLLPIWSQNVLVAVVFIGQFVARPEGGPAELPVLTPTERTRLLHLVRPLRSFLLDVLDRLERFKSHPEAGKRAVIENYVQQTLVHGPTLAGLSARLNLSTSRTSHVVRQTTGMNFNQIVERRRISVAKDLLSRSDVTVAAIGRQVGFQDAGYFSRYFRLKVGMTPGEYRRAVGRVPAV